MFLTAATVDFKMAGLDQVSVIKDDIGFRLKNKNHSQFLFFIEVLDLEGFKNWTNNCYLTEN